MAKSNYLIGKGWNINQASLVKFNPQPRSLGIKYTRRTYLGNGSVYDEGPYIELLWSALDSEVTYLSLMVQAGLDSMSWQQVTIYARNELWQYQRYNGVANRPLIGTDVDWQYFPQNVVLLIKDLNQL